MNAAQPQISEYMGREVARRMKRGDGRRLMQSRRTYYLDGHTVSEYDVPATDGIRVHRVLYVPATHESRCDCDACQKYARRWCTARQMVVESERTVARRLNEGY